MNKSIYEIQNPVDFKPYTHEYLIQALANMGQRIGIKGDGIEYKSFKFTDLIEDYSYSDKEWVGVIRYINNECNFGVTKKSSINNGDLVKYLVKDSHIFNKITLPYEVSFDVPINNIEKYKNGSIIANDGKFLTTILLGKYFGYDDNDANNSEIIYAKFNLEDNTLEKCIRIHFLCSSDIHNYYVLSKVEHTTENNYLQTVQVFDSSLLEEFQSQFENLFSYNENSEYFSLFSKDKDYIEYPIENPNITEVENDLNILSELSVVDLILKHTENKEYYAPKTFELKFDTEANQYESLSVARYNSEMQWLNEYGYNVNEQVNMLNNIISSLFYNLFLYFNKTYYIANKSTLIKRIICKLYESLCGDDYVGSIMYVPLDYEFHYISNSNDDLDIYYSNNIYVTMCNVSQYDAESFFNSTKNIIFDYDGIDKVKACNFEISYNSKYDNLINYINIKDLYTLPYINSNNNWSVNDTDSGISAMGKDAGNPNIIFAYSNVDLNDDSMFSILNNAANKNKIMNCTWKEQTFKVNTAHFTNPKSSSISCKCFIPVTTANNIKYFKNALIIMLSSRSCIDEAEQASYKYDYVSSMWTLSNEDDNSIAKFVCITDPENSEYALPFGSGIDTYSEFSNTSIGNLNANDILLLVANISGIGQENLALNSNNWITIRNKNAEEYNLSIDPEGNDVDQYTNDLNLAVQYNDSIEIIGNHIINKQTDKPYLANFAEDRPETSNYLYKKYSTATYVGKTLMPTAVQNLINVNHSYLISNMTIDGQTVVNSDLVLIKSIPTSVESIEYNQVEYSYQVSVEDGKYPEYIFNSNVPSVDMKEVFMRNVDVLNRVNIISLDHDSQTGKGKLFNSYIGTSYEDEEKNVLRIGTTKNNINIGSNSLINEADRTSFETQDTISIDFDKVLLNSKQTVSSNMWMKQTVDTTDYYTTTIRPIGKLSSLANSIYSYTGSYMKDNNIGEGVFGTNYDENGFSDDNLYINTDNLIYSDNDDNVLFKRVISYKAVEPTPEPEPDQHDDQQNQPPVSDTEITQFVNDNDLHLDYPYTIEEIENNELKTRTEYYNIQCPELDKIKSYVIELGQTASLGKYINDDSFPQDATGYKYMIVQNDKSINAKYVLTNDDINDVEIKGMHIGYAMIIAYNIYPNVINKDNASTADDAIDKDKIQYHYIFVKVVSDNQYDIQYDTIYINSLMKNRLGVDISSMNLLINEIEGSDKDLRILKKSTSTSTDYYLVLPELVGAGTAGDYEEVCYTKYDISILMYILNDMSKEVNLQISLLPAISYDKDKIVTDDAHNNEIFTNTTNSSTAG